MDLEKYLLENGLWHRFVIKPDTVHTVDASRESGIELGKITKNLVSRTSNGDYVLLIVPGDRRVDLRKAAKALNSSNVKLLSFEEAEAISGYPPGATPSVHHKTPLKVVLDGFLMNHETLFCGGGSRERLLELKTKDVLALDGAVVADITQIDQTRNPLSK